MAAKGSQRRFAVAVAALLPSTPRFRSLSCRRRMRCTFISTFAFLYLVHAIIVALALAAKSVSHPTGFGVTYGCILRQRCTSDIFCSCFLDPLVRQASHTEGNLAFLGLRRHYLAASGGGFGIIAVYHASLFPMAGVISGTDLELTRSGLTPRFSVSRHWRSEAGRRSDSHFPIEPPLASKPTDVNRCELLFRGMKKVQAGGLLCVVWLKPCQILMIFASI